MLFSSVAYLLFFLPAAVLGYRFLRDRGKIEFSQWFLAAASLAFYAWSDPQYLPLLGLSILVNYAIAQRMAKLPREQRKPTFRIGLLFNLGLLIAFKYLGFITGSLRDVGIPVPLVTTVAFPLGLSFFTLQQVMYLVDCFEELIPANRLVDHVSFVAFFPYLLLGPISRAKSIVRQLSKPTPDRARRHEALTLLVIGLSKKVILADSLARVVNAGYGSHGTWSSLEAWIFSIAYSLQLYFDFSGYSDMAMASARLLDIEVPQNFNAPFRSKTVTEFWQRWHMSLTAFITTYLYTPILRTMGKATMRKAALTSVVAMLIAGLWHGPSWTFVVFGGLHGVALAINQYWKRTKRRLPVLLPTILTLLFVNTAFVVFRAPNMSMALDHMVSLLPIRGTRWAPTEIASGAQLLSVALLLAVGSVVAYFGADSVTISRSLKPSHRRTAFLVVASVVCAVLICATGETQFVYAQF